MRSATCWPASGPSADMAVARSRQLTVKSPAEIARMRRAGRVVAEVLALVESELRPGVSTGELDRLAERHIRRSGAIPSFLGYPGANPRRPFPATRRLGFAPCRCWISSSVNCRASRPWDSGK